MLNLLVGCLNLGLVMGHPGGAGNCDSAKPANAMTSYANGAAGWSLTGPTANVAAGAPVTLTLSAGGVATQYKGISLYCESGNAKIGAFTMPSSSFQANSNCGPGDEGLTHTSSATKTTTSFTWTPPASTTALNVVCKGIVFNNNNQWQAGLATAAFTVSAGTAAPTTAGTTLAPTNSVAPTAAPAPSSAETVGVSMAACALALAMMA